MKWFYSGSDTINSLINGLYNYWQEPQDPFFMQGLESENYQAFTSWCSQVRQVERTLLTKLANQQLSPQNFRNFLLSPLTELNSSLVSPLYYFLRLKVLERKLIDKGYPKIFSESAREVGYRLRQALGAEPELTRDYFYYDLQNHLIELSAKRFSLNKLLNWIAFYKDLVDAKLYQSVKNAFKEFSKSFSNGEAPASKYKKLIFELENLFQIVSVVENKDQAPLGEKDGRLNFNLLALTGLMVTASCVSYQMNYSHSSSNQGLVLPGWSTFGIIGTTYSTWSFFSFNKFSYSQNIPISLATLVYSLPMMPLAASEIVLTNGEYLQLSSLNGTNGFTSDGVNANDYFGSSIASGDINGDGKVDILIGAYYASPGNRTHAGASYVVFGQTGGTPATLDLSALNGTNGFVINGVDIGDYSGCAIASGDINGDNITDVLIGAYGAGLSINGASYVVFGHTGLFPASLELSVLNGTNGFVMTGVNSLDLLGWAIASGDINGDGKSDVLIGAKSASPGGRNTAGASYVVFGHTGPFSASFDLSTLNGSNGFVINGVNASDTSGYSIASGDINADGLADVLIGAYRASPGGRTDAGASYVVFGQTEVFPATFELSDLNGTNGFVLNGVNTTDYTGYSITSGDINGDNKTDLLIGACQASYNVFTSAGATYVIFGRTEPFSSSLELSTLNGTDGFVIYGIHSGEQSAWSLASADINADGKSDVLIGTPNGYNNYNPYGSGVSYVVYGHGGLFPSFWDLGSLNGTNGFTINGVAQNDQSGWAIASGDINADGLADVLIGASHASSGGKTKALAGASYVVFGSNITVFASPSSIPPTPSPGSVSSSPSISTTPDSATKTNNHLTNSSKVGIGVGVTLGVLGLFAVGGAVGYKLYQRRNGHLTDKNRREIEGFVLINGLFKKEAQALYEQTGIQVDMPDEFPQSYQKVVLGESEFGKIKLAYDRMKRKFVAVRKIKGMVAIDASAKERAIHKDLSEAELPHVLPLLCSVTTEDSHRMPIIYQFVPLAGLGNGERLGQQLVQPTDIELKTKLIQHMAQGLLTGIAAMHNNGTYHLSIKPQSYVATITGMVYVTDFSNAQQFEPGKSCWIDEGHVISSRDDSSYLSPECLAFYRYCHLNKGQEQITPAAECVERYDAEKADSWAVGLVLLELMLGHYPLSDEHVGFVSRLCHWDSTYIHQLLEIAFAEMANKKLISSLRGQTLFEIVKGLLVIDPNKRLTVREAINHSLFKETLFEEKELMENFQGLSGVRVGSTTQNNNETRRDIGLEIITPTSRSEHVYPNPEVSMALKS